MPGEDPSSPVHSGYTPTMAYVVNRGDRGYELRESHSSPRGPRSRTLASFRVLTDEVVARAVSRADRPLDASQVRALATAAGAPVGASVADSAARTLLQEWADGRLPSPVLRARLMQRLKSTPYQPAAAHPGGPVDWVGVSLADRGAALVQLLDLGDHLPRRPAGPLNFPAIGRRSDRHA